MALGVLWSRVKSSKNNFVALDPKGKLQTGSVVLGLFNLVYYATSKWVLSHHVVLRSMHLVLPHNGLAHSNTW